MENAAEVAPRAGRSMEPGDTVEGRFVLDHVAGEGGMSTVWCAYDQLDQKHVALKVALGAGVHQVHPLAREADLLKGLDHPAVIRSMGQGITEQGFHYLVLEWLEGEDLSERLERGPLWVEDSLMLVQNVADALATIHAKGIVHRDLKPSNLFLVNGNLDKVKMIDFGIACIEDERQVHTQSRIIGTPFYMSPEQARGDANLDARADLYALGCILFECLTGKPPFVAPNAMAVLTKVLFEEALAPSHFRRDLPYGVDALVAELLAKDVASRPGDALAVIESIQALRSGKAQRVTPLQTKPSALTQNERRLVSVVLATEIEDSLSIGSNTSELQAPSSEAETISLPPLAPSLPELRELVMPYGAQLEVLRDGSIAAVVSGSSSPTDVAANAARAALAIQAVIPTTQVALVTGWEVFAGTKPLGQVIDTAATLLESRRRPMLGHVLLDRMTAALLGERFLIAGDDQGPTVVGEHDQETEIRKLLGKPTTCVGRKRELRLLDDLFDECTTDLVARPIVVTAEPGVGKSRLREEFIQRLKLRYQDVEIWIARGDSMRQKAAFGLLAQFIRRAANLYEGEPLDIRRQKLAARVARRVDSEHQQRVTEFLGEIVGTPFPEEDSVQLHAARQEAMLMGDQMRRAWVDFVEAECEAHPVVLVLEDLQWGDQPTVDYVDTALRLLPNLPLLVLALARPEVGDIFPALWRDRGVTDLQLGSLSRKASEQFVQQVLGHDISMDVVNRLIERSAGNAFFLEELVRAFAEERTEQVPETVLAMMQSRLASLDPEQRRVLRAGSLFGEVFWRSAIVSLLGLYRGAERLDERLADLEKREWITRRYESKFRGETEYVFRHGLIREAAYSMLTNEDKALGHRLCGEWLEQAGETAAMTLATHFDLGEAPVEAAAWYGVAAHQALGGNDLGGAIDRAERAMACGASGSDLGELALIRAEAHRWQGNYVEGEKWARQAMEIFPEGSESWYHALREALASLVDLNAQDRILAMADMLDDLWQGPDTATGPQVVAMVWMAIRLYELSFHDYAEMLHQKLESVELRFGTDPVVHAYLMMERAFREGFLDNMASCGKAMEAAMRRFEQLGDLRSACHMQVNLGHVYNEVGLYAENVQLLQHLLKNLQTLGLAGLEAPVRAYLGKALMGVGNLGDALAMQTAAASAFTSQHHQRLEGLSRTYLALVLRAIGYLDQAESEARQAINVLDFLPTAHPFAIAVLASVLLAKGCVPEALAQAEQAVVLDHNVEEGDALIGLIFAEALEASGRHQSAREAIALARDRLLTRADKIRDNEWRRWFLQKVPENARTLALAEAWLDEVNLEGTT